MLYGTLPTDLKQKRLKSFGIMRKRNHFRDNAPMSVNGGKKNSVCGYHRQKLSKMGIAPEFMARVISPLGSQFTFEKLDKALSITPIKDIPNPIVKDIVSRLFYSGELRPNKCYSNALVVAIRLNEAGVSVQCVDGYYNIYGRWCKHRFNVLDGHFFDATAEFFIKTPLSLIEYHSMRLYSAQELYAISAAFSFLNKNPYRIYTMSTLPYNPLFCNPEDEIGECINEFCLDENGVIRMNDRYLAA